MRRLIGHVDSQQVVQHLDGLAVATLLAQQAGQAISHIDRLLAQPTPRNLQPVLVLRLASAVSVQQVTAIQLERQVEVIQVVGPRQLLECRRIDQADLGVERDPVTGTFEQVRAERAELRQGLAQIVARALFPGARP